jgi:hypothetical protein
MHILAAFIFLFILFCSHREIKINTDGRLQLWTPPEGTLYDQFFKGEVLINVARKLNMMQKYKS